MKEGNGDGAAMEAGREIELDMKWKYVLGLLDEGGVCVVLLRRFESVR